MSPITRRRLSVLMIVAFPLLAWITAASLASGVAVNRWDARTTWHLLIATAQYPVLYIPPAIGFALSLVAVIALSRMFKRTAGFEGDRFTRHIRGTKVVPIAKLRSQCTDRVHRQVDVASVPMPVKVENLHSLIGGATGSGKSVVLRRMAKSVQKRRDRMFVIDPDGDLLSKFWKPGDIILNPYDARSPGWAFFNEIRAEYDWKRLSHSMVPMSQDKSAEEWNDYGRLLLRETAKKLYTVKPDKAHIDELFRLCTIEDPAKLKDYLEGTLAESLFVGSSEASKALSSARFVLSNKLSEHTSMKSGAFSIRDWIDDPNGGNLFINWREDMVTAMKPLVSSWADVFITAVLSLPEDAKRRWWLFIDELASLDALPSLEDGLTKGRKKGLRIVAGLQSTSQLDYIYGEKKAQTIRASFRNLLVLGGSRTDHETAEDLSKSLGEHEVERHKYSVSRSVGDRNTNDQNTPVTERVVTAAQIQAFDDLTGYVAFAGKYPISRFKLQFQPFAQVIEPFIESNQLKRIPRSTQSTAEA